MTPRKLAVLACALALEWAPLGGGASAWWPGTAPIIAGTDDLEGGPLPAAIWWQSAERPSLSHNPLEVLSAAPRVVIEQEWAPLYSDRSGARINFARRTLSARAPAGWLRTAAVIENRSLVARRPGGAWAVDAERPSGERALAALGFEGARAGVAGAAGVSEWQPGAALAGRAVLAPEWLAEANWSRWTVGGSMDVTWNDEHVDATARWIEQRAGWRLAWQPGPALGASIEQHAIDRTPAAFDTRDRAAPQTAWRATQITARWPALGLVWQVEGTVGEGREGLRLWRDGTSYALAAGPVQRADVALLVTPGPWRLRAWGGHWRGEARGAVALWPFDGLAGAAGSRQVAQSEASFEHAGLSVERAVGVRRATEGGLAVAWFQPRTSWESWLAPLLGLGRSDEASGETDVRDAFAIGAKLATRVEIGGVMLRAEVVQWAPVVVREVSRTSQTLPSPPSSGGGTDAGSGSGARGGTIVRLAFEGLR